MSSIIYTVLVIAIILIIIFVVTKDKIPGVVDKAKDVVNKLKPGK